MILDKNQAQGIDNNQSCWNDISEKLKEEAAELNEAISLNDKHKISEETLDVIQVCIRSLEKLEKENINLDQIFALHNKKLLSRGWTCKGVVEICVRKRA